MHFSKKAIYMTSIHLKGFLTSWIIREMQIKSIMKKSLHTPSVQFSCSVMSDSLRSHGLQHIRPPCPSPIPRVYSNSCPLSQWSHPTISSSVVPFSSSLQSFPASRSFLMSQLFTSGGQIIRASASASVVPMNIQGWFPLGLTGWLSLQSKGLSRVCSSITIWKSVPQCSASFMAQLSHTYMTIGKNIALTIGPLLAKWCLFFLIICLCVS